MNTRQSKRQRDIKTKLMASICMLLVSSIMMVSTTYAWFTLSTAPEVTGITTAVGANGNLEMALQPLDGDSSKITSSTADSMAVKPAKEANVTWGNLVNVSDTTVYGLNEISLYPSALNTETVTEDGKSATRIKINPLTTPVYGADGRISNLAENTITGTYQDGSFYENATIDGVSKPAFGVRAVGTASGMTARNLAYRSALSAANTAASQAKSVASTSLNNNGSALADVAITHALNSGAENYNDTDVAAMRNVVNDLLGVEGKKGSLQYIEEALKYYIVANSIAASGTESTYEELQTAILAATLDQLAAGSVDGAVLPAGYTDDTGYIAKLNAAKDSATTAQTKLNALSGNSYSWEQISPALSPLVNTGGLKINDMTVETVMADPGSVASSIMKNGLILTMASGSGVYADIADFCGNYSAGIIIPELAYGTLVVPDVEATMNTSGISPTYLDSAAKGVGAFQSATGNGGDNPLTDFYGYILDLAFRTNAADSYLQLQPNAVDRIYAEGSNINTMGHGATMSFKTSSTTFNPAAVTRLMGAIRVVFFDTNSKNIINYARLDAAKATTEADGTVTMPLFMCDATGTAIQDVTTTTHNETVAIMPLNQNEIHELSVLVYLDGNNVDNDDVAADVAQSMSGSMNLQFSSSATLVAMDYSNLMSGDGGALDNNGGSEDDDDDDETPAVTPLTNVTVTGATKGTAVYDGTNIVIQLSDVVENSTATIKIGDAEAVAATILTQDGHTGITHAAADIAADTAIVVTVTAPEPTPDPAG